MLNLSLCVDLILTIYDPFSPAYRRVKLFYIASIAAAFMLVMVIFGLDTSENNAGDTPEYDCIEGTAATQYAQI